MQAFDFDNTIYKGESSFDFALFVVRHEVRMLKYLPIIIKVLLSYKSEHMNVDEYMNLLNKYVYLVMENKDRILELVDKFWETHERKLYLNMLEKIHFNDVIITTAPDFLMKGIRRRLNTRNILCTKTDMKKGKLVYLNFHENKVKAFKKKYPKKMIKNFYTDSYNDEPFMDFSKNVYLVNHGDITKIK